MFNGGKLIFINRKLPTKKKKKTRSFTLAVMTEIGFDYSTKNVINSLLFIPFE
jgi:hypothetical protein